MASGTQRTSAGYAGGHGIRYRRGERMASLLIQPPNGAGHRLELGEERLLIGRGHEAHLKLDDPTVSRSHASLVKGPHGYVLTAEGSQPIRVGKEEHRQLLLTHGVRFELGKTVVTFLDPRSAVTEQLPSTGTPDDDGPIRLPPSGAARFLRALFRTMLIGLLLCTVAGILVHAFVAPMDTWWDRIAGTEPEPAEPGELPPLDPAIALADPDAPLYALDTETPRVELPLTNAGGSLVGELADGGRRRILYAPEGGAAEEVFPAEYNLPGAGLAVAGRLFVCANRLVGAPSELTEGAMPDPRGGVELWCRERGSSGWAEPARLPLDGGAPWLAELRPGAGSVVVRYVRDQASTLVGQPRAGDGLFAVTFDGSGYGSPTLIADHEPLVERIDPP